MTKQPEALRLAEVLDLLWLDGQTPRQAAAELRRLSAINAQLLAALKNSSPTVFIDPSKSHLRNAALEAAHGITRE